MNARKWPVGRTPPPGWVVSPELSELYGYNVIVRDNERSRIERRIDTPSVRRMKRSGRRQALLGAALMALGISLRR